MRVVSRRDSVAINGYPIANGDGQTHHPGGLMGNALGPWSISRRYCWIVCSARWATSRRWGRGE